MTTILQNAGEEIRFAFDTFSLGMVLVATTDKGIAAILLGDGQDELHRELVYAFPQARLYRGLGFVTNNDLDKAMADFDAAVRADPTYPFAYDNRGDVWRLRKQFDRAIVEYNEALRRDPDFISSYVNRGMAFEEMGNKLSAKADYEAVLKMPNKGRPIDKWARETAESQLKKLGKVE